MENQEFDPRDLNKDGKVTFEERVKYAAGKAGEAIQSAAGTIAGEAEEIVGKVKAYSELSPEEKKAKQEEWKGKATDVAGKAADAAKEVLGEMKENADKLFKKKEA